MGTRHVSASFGEVHQLPQIKYTNTAQRDADTVFSTNPNSLFQSVFIEDLQELQMLITNDPVWVTTMATATPGIDTVLAVNQPISIDDRTVIITDDIEFNITGYDQFANDFNLGSSFNIRGTDITLSTFTGDQAGNITATSQFQLGSSQIVLTDEINSQGIVNAGDYSGNFVDESLVTKRYVDALNHENIYTEDGTIDGVTRQVTGENSALLRFDFYNTDAATFTRSSTFFFNQDLCIIGRNTGDGAGNVSAIQSLQFSPGEITLTDTLNLAGIKNAADYSANFTDESLITKRYADSLIHGNIYTEDGTIDSGTTRNFTGEDNSILQFSLFDTNVSTFTEVGQLAITPFAVFMGRNVGDGAGATSSVQQLEFTSTNIVFKDSTNLKGPENEADYSANFTDESLVTKRYADALDFGSSDEEILFNNSGSIVGQDNFIFDHTSAVLRLGNATNPMKLAILRGGIVPAGTGVPAGNTAIHTQGDGSANADIKVACVADPAFSFAKIQISRAGETSNLVVDGDVLGLLEFEGHDGTDYESAAAIRVRVDGVAAAGDMPGRIDFQTTPPGATAPVDRMRIDSAGNVGIGPFYAPSFLLDVNGTGAFNNLILDDTTANQVVFDDGTNLIGSANFTWDESTLRLQIGADGPAQSQVLTIPRAGGTPVGTFPNANAAIHMKGTSGIPADIYQDCRSNTAAEAGVYTMRRSRDSGAVTDGDLLGSLFFEGYDGVDQFQLGAYLRAQVSSTGGDDLVPTSLLFGVRSTSGSVQEKMRLYHNGNLGLNTTTPQHNLDLQGSMGLKRLSSSGNLNSFDEVVLAKAGFAANKVTQFFLTGAGVLYTVGDTLSPQGGTGTDAVIQVTSVDGFGEITGFVLVSGGSYTVDPTPLEVNILVGGTGNSAFATLVMGGIAVSSDIQILTADIIDDRIFWVQDETGSASPLNPITVKGETGTINGEASILITVPYGGFWVRAFGGNLFAIG